MAKTPREGMSIESKIKDSRISICSVLLSLHCWRDYQGGCMQFCHSSRPDVLIGGVQHAIGGSTEEIDKDDSPRYEPEKGFAIFVLQRIGKVLVLARTTFVYCLRECTFPRHGFQKILLSVPRHVESGTMSSRSGGDECSVYKMACRARRLSTRSIKHECHKSSPKSRWEGPCFRNLRAFADA